MIELNKSKIEREAKKIETDVVSANITSIRSVNRAIARFQAAKKLHPAMPETQINEELYQLFYVGAKWHPAWESAFNKSTAKSLGETLKIKLAAPAARGRTRREAPQSDPIPQDVNQQATIGPPL